LNKVYWGDCRDSLRQMKQESVVVQTCVTSPPYYGLRDYGVDGQIGAEQKPEEFIKNLVEVFAGVWDVLANDGTLWVNLGDTYFSTTKGSGGSNPETSPLQAGKNKENKQGFEVRKISAGNTSCKPKDLMGMPWRLAFALQEFGWYLRQDIIWHKPNPMPESITDRCTKSHEYIFLLSKNQKYYFDCDAIKEKGVIPAGTLAAKGSENRQNQAGVNARPPEYKEYDGYRNKRDVWTVNTKPYSGAHFAVFPEELIEPCILAGSRVGDIVLDPFFGSGTTGQVAQNLGRKWIGCELNKDYEKLQNERLIQQGLELA